MQRKKTKRELRHEFMIEQLAKANTKREAEKEWNSIRRKGFIKLLLTIFL